MTFGPSTARAMRNAEALALFDAIPDIENWPSCRIAAHCGICEQTAAKWSGRTPPHELSPDARAFRAAWGITGTKLRRAC